MIQLNHYIIFQRTEDHCTVWLLRAESLYEAMKSYILDQYIASELLDDGSITTPDGFGGRLIYKHPLACIEAEEKLVNGGTE